MPLFGSGVSRLKKKGDVAGLVELLGDKDPRTRQEARNALAEIRDPRAAELLASALRTKDSAVRSAGRTWARSISDARDPVNTAAELLAMLGGEGAVGPLVEALRNSEYAVRAAAADALGTLGETRAVEPLTACLDDIDGEVQKSALGALRELGEPATEALRVSLHGRDPAASFIPLRALASLADADAVGRLAAMVRDGSLDDDLRSSTAVFLWRLDNYGTFLPNDRLWPPQEARNVIRETLATFRSDPAAISFLVYVFKQTLDRAEVVATGSALATFGDRSLEPLLAEVGDRGMRERYRAVAPMSEDEAKLLILELTNRQHEKLQSIYGQAGFLR